MRTPKEIIGDDAVAQLTFEGYAVVHDAEIDRQIIRERHADLQAAKHAYAEYREKFDDARGGDARDWLRVGSECSDK